LIERRSDRLVARNGESVLFEYVFRPDLPALLAPRPYFHPVRTLSGVVVTDHQPPDHAWHLGLAYSWPVVNESNLWGGPTYRRDQGYVQLDNLGRIEHVAWKGFEEALEWIDGDGRRIATERRVIGEPQLDESAGAWSLALESEVANDGAEELRLGSPTTEGRPMAGYAGLALRGPDSLKGADIVLDAGPVAGEPMGERSTWLGFTAAGATVAVVEDPLNPGVPNRWFVRTQEYLLIASSPVFDRELHLAPGERLRMGHRLLVGDGVWDAQRLAAAISPYVGTRA
jgi:Methane oxygenase PmoA